MISTLPLLMISTVGLLLYILIRDWRQRKLRGGLPLPPGPKGLPILGNILDIDASTPWVTFVNWSKKYGDLLYLTVLGYDVIVINSEELASTLLESEVYSDRPLMPAFDLFGMGYSTASLPYGKHLRRQRKMYHIGLKKEAILEYKTMQLLKVHEFLENLIASPAQLNEHTRTLTTAITMAVAYGYDVAPVADPFVTKVDHYLASFTKVLTPVGLMLIGGLSFLRYIPSWFPGGRYKRVAEECRRLSRDILDGPKEFMEAEMASGTTRRSLVKELSDKHATKDNIITAEDEETIKEVATNLTFAGGKSSDSVIQVFLLAMILHPEVQIKAQEEIDRVIEDNRLPDFSDRENLPYVEAVYLETLRWRTTVPITIPHCTSSSDVYNGYYIPKGAIVFLNIWAILHDEEHFPDPTSFKPERHLLPTGKVFQGSATASFGYGRRYCPGKYLADQTIWAIIVSILATMRIGKGKDSTGCEIDVKPEFTTGFSIRPKPFVCSIEPRSANAERLIHAVNTGN